MQTNTKPIGQQEDQEPPKKKMSQKQGAAIFYELAWQHRHKEFQCHGLRKTLQGWASYSKIPLHNLFQRVFIHGWTIAKAISTPLKKDKKKRSMPIKPTHTPISFFMGEGIYGAYSTPIGSVGQGELIVGGIYCDVENSLWKCREYPDLAAPSRGDLVIQILSLKRDMKGDLVLDPDCYKSLSSANLEFKFRRTDV